MDKNGFTIIEVLTKEQERSGKFKEDEIEKIKELYEEQIKILNNRVRSITERINHNHNYESKSNVQQVATNSKKTLDSRARGELEEHGTILNYKNFISEPVIGREKEMENLMVSLAQDKKSPIIVGESGVGKSALVYELAYLIENDKVPSFLKNKIIYEVSPGDLVAGCSYVGQFEGKLKAMFEVAKKNDVILFIDEIHTMYGVGTGEKKKTGMEEYVKHFLDRNENIKLICTTTEEEYQKFISGDALKRRFEKIVVKEPDEKMLRKIISKVIDDYCLRGNISFKNKKDKSDIVDAIIEATDKVHRVYNDRLNNPDLSISIIDKAFAFAKYFDSDNISKEHFMKAFEYCDRIYESARNNAIIRLKSKKNNASKSEEKGAKILKVDFTKFKR